MIGVTIGVGEGWYERAVWAANRMAFMTGLHCEIVKDTVNDFHPSWCKLNVPLMYPHEESFLIFDSDIICMKPWNPRQLYIDSGHKFLWCRDVDTDPVIAEAKEFGIERYHNAGIFICGRHHLPLMTSAFLRGPVYGKWLEQTALNEAVQDSSNGTARTLPRAYNTLLWPKIDDYSPEALTNRHVVNLHAASLNGDWRRLQGIQEGIDAYEACNNSGVQRTNQE